MGDVLLVTGSRALCDTPAAEAWARDMLRERLTFAVERVVAGDACGPDEWAHEVAKFRCRDCSRWCLSGEVRYRIALVWWTEAWWLPRSSPKPRTHDAWDQRAIARNRAMVEHAARVGGARCLALVAPWSRTCDTQHTDRLARKHGLAVEVLTCPAEHGPGGVW